MTILFAISVVAFVAIMWASISIAQHVRRTRHRRRAQQALDSSPKFTPSPEAARAAEALAAGSWGRTSRPDWKAAPPPAPEPDPEPIRDFVPAFSPKTVDRPRAETPAPPAAAPTPAPKPSPAATPTPSSSLGPLPAPPAIPEIRFPLTSQRLASSAAVAIARESSAVPVARPEATPAPVESSATVKAATNFQLRRPPAPSSDSRADLAYFNKDMGDLRDPEPRFRERPRGR